MTYMSIKQFIPAFYDWEENPEPDKSDPDPNVILDDNMDSVTWLFHKDKPKEEWLIYRGNLAERKQ